MIKLENNQYKIIDSHLHLPWQDECSTIEKKLERLQREMKENGIDYGILIADSILDSNIGNNEQCLKAISNSNNLFLVFGFSPLEGLDDQLIFARELLEEKKIVGVKLFPGHEDFCMNDPRIKDVISLCIKYGVPLLVHTEWNSEDYPKTSFPRKEKAVEYLQHLVEVCPERVIFGSDYGSLSIAEHLELVLEAKLKEDEIKNILYENANRIFKLGL